MDKKQSKGLNISNEAHREFKLLAVQTGLPMGQMVKALCDFWKSGQYIQDEMFQRRFEALKETAVLNASSDGGGWSGEQAEAMRQAEQG